MSEDVRIRALIVDDEPKARLKIRTLLSRHADVEIIGDCINGYEAITAIQAQSPDLVFLDIKMPEINGFEMLERIEKEQRPCVIFVTDYAEYAQLAFDVHAVDFLVKPLYRKRFDEALGQARSWLALQREENGAPPHANSSYRKILGFKARGRVFVLHTDKIEWIEAEGKWVRLHFGSESPLLREPIGALETELDPDIFMRIHRSYIVNLDYILEIRPLSNQKCEVMLRGHKEPLPASEKGRKKLAARLGTSF